MYSGSTVYTVCIHCNIYTLGELGIRIREVYTVTQWLAYINEKSHSHVR